MKVCVTGKGGREHALAWAVVLKASPEVERDALRDNLVFLLGEMPGLALEDLAGNLPEQARTSAVQKTLQEKHFSGWATITPPFFRPMNARNSPMPQVTAIFSAWGIAAMILSRTPVSVTWMDM